MESIRPAFQIDPLRSRFFGALLDQYLTQQEGWGTPFGSYYEFGVAGGGTLPKFVLSLKSFCKYRNLNPANSKI
jgi:hypothetical protein